MAKSRSRTATLAALTLMCALFTSSHATLADRMRAPDFRAGDLTPTTSGPAALRLINADDELYDYLEEHRRGVYEDLEQLFGNDGDGSEHEDYEDDGSPFGTQFDSDAWNAKKLDEAKDELFKVDQMLRSCQKELDIIAQINAVEWVQGPTDPQAQRDLAAKRKAEAAAARDAEEQWDMIDGELVRRPMHTGYNACLMGGSDIDPEVDFCVDIRKLRYLSEAAALIGQSERDAYVFSLLGHSRDIHEFIGDGMLFEARRPGQEKTDMVSLEDMREVMDERCNEVLARYTDALPGLLEKKEAAAKEVDRVMGIITSHAQLDDEATRRTQEAALARKAEDDDYEEQMAEFAGPLAEIKRKQQADEAREARLKFFEQKK